MIESIIISQHFLLYHIHSNIDFYKCIRYCFPIVWLVRIRLWQDGVELQGKAFSQVIM